MSFLEKSKHKTLFRVGITYLVVSWLLIQLVGTLTPVFDLPVILVRGIAFMLIMGYPIIMMLTWVYGLTHERTRDWPADNEAGSGNSFSVVIVSLISLSIIILLLDIYVLDTSEQNDTGVRSDNTVPAPDSPTAENASRKSIAVLPFTAQGEDSGQSYFSDGISQSLINRLAMMPALQVAGRESSFHFRNRNEEPALIGEKLQVENLLRGSVRKSGNTLQLTANLVNANEGSSLWSKTYDAKPVDVFTIQNDIAEEVIAILSVSPDTINFSTPGMTREIEAYDRALLGRFLYNRLTPGNVFRAIDLLNEAVRLDPGYGQGWLLLGNIYAGSQPMLPIEETDGFSVLADEAYAMAEKAAPDMPGLILVNAGKLRNQGRFQEAEALYLHYFERYGYSVPQTMGEYAQLLSRTGQMNEAIAMLQRVRRQEPLAPRFIYQEALHELYRGREDVARDLAFHGLSMDGGEWLYSAIHWEIAMREGELARAAQMIREYYSGAFDESEVNESTVSRRYMEKFADILATENFEESTDNIIALINDPSITPLELRYTARLVALMGEPEIALDYWFGQMASPAIWDKVYDDMRRLPDFNRLLQEKGLVDYWRATGNWGDFCVAAGGRDFVCK